MDRRNLLILSIFMSFILLMTGFTEKRTSPTDEGLIIVGYILGLEDGRIVVAKDISSEKYLEIKDKTLQELDEERLSLFYLNYENYEHLNVGDEVKVWIDGGIDDSNPAQASVRKIEVLK